MSFASDMEDAAYDYAAGLRKRGYLDVTVFRYDTPLDNREPYRRDHRTAFGWAVRYTSSPQMDRDVLGDRLAAYRENRGEPIAKWHDRSVTMFTAPAGLVSCDAWLTQDRLTAAAVIADFAGEDAVPMYVSHWSPSADQPGVEPENVPLVPTVGLKRFPARKDDSSYPWQIGPHRFYHVIMTPATGGHFTRGPEPAAQTDR